MNLKLTCVLSDIAGVTGLQIIRVVMTGERDDAHKLAAYRDRRGRRGIAPADCRAGCYSAVLVQDGRFSVAVDQVPKCNLRWSRQETSASCLEVRPRG